jgi:lipoate-protein ligase A
MLRVITHTCGSAEENLALDDSLLGSGCETLRFWESPVPFVVLGRSGRAEQEADLENCRAAGVPVLRRSSGGGAVLQGPGCLNYTLIVSLTVRPELANVAESYRVLLSRVAGALGLAGLEVCGSDLLLAGRKVSGNAQRRTRGWLLHHGTLLHALDLRLVERFLREPLRTPPHRRGRTHSEFLAALPLDREALISRLASNLPVWLQTTCPQPSGLGQSTGWTAAGR